MGADVVKVEAVQRPDGIRFSAAVRPHARSAVLREVGALPRSATSASAGSHSTSAIPTAWRSRSDCVEQSDVVAENFTPQVLEKFGLDWDTVHALNPPDDLCCACPRSGSTGRGASRGGFAQTMEQLTGMAWVTGYDGGPPIIPGGPVDPMVGAHAALALVAALEHRARTGDGELVEVPLVEVATAVTADQVIRYSIDGTLLGRRGEGGVYKCVGGDDEWVAIDRSPRSDARRRARRMVRGSYRPTRRRRTRSRKAFRPPRWCRGTRHSTIRSSGRGTSSNR